jgi:hypothetical protein
MKSSLQKLYGRRHELVDRYDIDQIYRFAEED